MLNVIINSIFYVIKALSDIIITPVQNLLVNAIPSLGSLITGAQSFLSNYVFNNLLFMKKIFMNMTFFPQELFTIIISYIIIKIGLHVGMQAYRFGVTIYNKFKI